jgi:GDPmannose 4,6-dehydratase
MSLGIEIDWQGSDANEVGVVKSVNGKIDGVAIKPGQTIVRIDPHYFRPAEVDSLLGDSSKAKQKLNWEPKISFAEIVSEMTEADLALARREQAMHGRGLKVYRPDLEGNQRQ